MLIIFQKANLWNYILLSNEDYDRGGVTIRFICNVGDHEASARLKGSSGAIFGVFVYVILLQAYRFMLPCY